jgi:hypothetical protein
MGVGGRTPDGIMKAVQTSLPGFAVLLGGQDDGRGLTHHYPWAFVRRGFVAEVRLSAAAFLGGPCRSCYIEVGGRRIGCRVCSDTGRTPGLAGPLFAAHPITAVRLTDLEPFEWTPDAGSSSFDQPPQYSWINEEKQRGMGDERRRRAMVPALLWPEVVKRPKRVRHDEYARFFTRQAARDALSAAAVAFGRAAANLTAQPAVTG